MTKQATFRVGIVGAGMISEHHIGALATEPDVEIVGIVDLDEAKAAAVAERFGLEPARTLQELRQRGANVIHVLTPPGTHAAVAIEALELGCHVLVEKPLAEDPADCRRIEQVAQRQGLQVCVNHSLLYDPLVQRALSQVRAGRIGRVVAVDILRGSDYPPYAGGPLPPQYRNGGYPFRDLGVHALYLMRAFLGPIEHVSAHWRNLGGDPNLAFDEWRALVRCQGGLGQFQLSWNVKPLQSQLIVQGTRGVLRLDLFCQFQSVRRPTPLPKAAERMVHAFADTLGAVVDVPRAVLGFVRGTIKPYQGLRNLIAAFYQALRTGQPMPVGLGEASEVVGWVEQVARDADEQQREHLRAIESPPGPVDVLVTGASGALGSAIVERLLERGASVRCLVRRADSSLPEGVQVAVGDLGDAAAVDRAIGGAHVVVHAGAAMRGPWPAHHGATVLGTAHVIAACRKHAVSRLVHVSSLSVLTLAGEEQQTPVDERTPYEPHPEQRGSYTRAKLEAERLVAEAVVQHGLPAVILRPGQIFGRRIPLLNAAIARRVGSHWLVLGDGEVLLPLVYIDDVVDAALLALEADLGRGEVIHVVDDNVSFTQNEVLDLVIGHQVRPVRVPRGLAFGAGRLSELALGALGRASPVPEYRLRSALAKRCYRSREAEQALGWKPRVGVRAGIERERQAGRLVAS